MLNVRGTTTCALALLLFAASTAKADSVTQQVSPTTVQSGSTPLSTQLLDPSGVSNPTYTNTVRINGAGHVLDPSTVKAPANSTISYSTDGVTFGPTGSAASRYVRFAGPIAAGAGAVAPVGATLTTAIAGLSDGDGFAPILTPTRVYNVNHHDPIRVECHELSDGASCPGYPFTHPSDAVAGFAFHSTVDTSTGYLWTPGQIEGPAGTATGFACIDVGDGDATVPTSCGWVPTGTGAWPTRSIEPGDYGASIQGGDEYGRKLYAIDTTGKIQCVDMATATPCSGQPYNVGLTASDAFGIQLTRIGDTSKFIARTNPPTGLSDITLVSGNGPSQVMCFDASTNAACAGWSGPQTIGGGQNTINGGVISIQSTPGTWDGFCGFISRNSLGANIGNTTMAVQCRSLADGSSVTTPTGFGGNGMTNGEDGWQFGWAGLGVPDTSGTRVYFTMWRISLFIPGFLAANDRLVCYDFNTGGFCPGYPTDFFGGRPGMSQPMSQTYATQVDPTGGCVWTLGDPGVMVRRDAQDPSQPCDSAFVSQVVDRADSYCGTTPGDVATADWGLVRIRNVSEGTDYSGAVVTIQDRNGVVVPGFDHVPFSGSSVDISSIPATGATSVLRVSVEFGGASGAAFDAGTSFLEITWNSSEKPRTCVGSVVQALDCQTVADAMSFDTTAVFATAGAAGGTPRTATNALTRSAAEVASCNPPENGVPGITVKKTVSGSTAVRVGDPVTFKITVTNSGAVAFKTVTVSDPLCPTNLVGPDKSGDSTPASLDPGETWGYTCTIKVKLAQLGQSLTNTASVKADDVNGGTVTGQGKAVVTVSKKSTSQGSIAGRTRMTATAGCVASKAVATVSGPAIKQVTFTLDGRKWKTVTKPNVGSTGFRATRSAKSLGYGSHRVRATVTFVNGASPKTKTLVGSISRCKPRAAAKPDGLTG